VDFNLLLQNTFFPVPAPLTPFLRNDKQSPLPLL